MSQTADQIRAYVLAKVNPVFEPLMIDLLVLRPDDVVQFVIKWMQERGSQKQVISKLSEIKVEEKQKPIQINKKKQQSSSSEEDEEDDETIDDLVISTLTKQKNQVPRVSVSAESYGLFNKKENFKARDIKKSNSQKERIINKIMQSFMFQALDMKDRDIVVNAMEIKEFQSGDWVIRQGEDGDNLYVVDQGQLDCFKLFVKGNQPTHLKVYQPGESFGELSLLYNAPRAASIQSKTQSVLFALDRATFNNIVKTSAIKKREYYEAVLQKIEVLKSLDKYELTQICDCVKEKRFVAGEYLIRQGESGDKFYMIEEGELIATKSMIPGDQPTKVFQYKAGDYFGELALINNQPRQANIVAESDGCLVYLESDSFKRLLGPMENILARNSDRYSQYIDLNK